jgi:hypothetical protein
VFCKSPGSTFPKNAILETENINFELTLKLAGRLLGLHAHAMVCHHLIKGHEKPDIEKRFARLRQNVSQELPLRSTSRVFDLQSRTPYGLDHSLSGPLCEEGKTRPVHIQRAPTHRSRYSGRAWERDLKSFCYNFLPAFFIQTCYLRSRSKRHDDNRIFHFFSIRPSEV